MNYLKINNKEVMPIISFGVYKITDLNECEQSVLDALEIGYRGIDTAQVYANEEAVGKALKKTNAKRSDIFLTTKVWISNFTYKDTIRSVKESLVKLQTEYIDLILLHQALGNYYEAFRALEDLQDQGLVKYIGVSNFYPDRLADLALYSRKKPQVNQFEINPFFQRENDIQWNKKYDVIAQSWGPLAQGRNDIFKNIILKKIADKYNKTIAQVILRWFVELDIPFAVKSSNKERIKENFDIFDFKLSKEDLQAIKNMNLETSCVYADKPHNTPEFVEWLHKLDSERAVIQKNPKNK